MKKLFTLFSFLFLFASVMWGQILQWNTFGNAGTETTEPSIFNDANISASNLTQGTITAAANGNRFGGSGWFNTGNTVAGNTLAEAIAGNDYIEFIVTPNSGYSFTPTSFDFSWQSSSSGPKNVTLRSSTDSYASNIGTSAVTSSIASYSITISGLTGITTATTFRLYGYGATATTGTGGFDVASNIVNVQLNGSVSAVGASLIGVTPTSLSGFSYVEGSGPSTSQSYDLTGSNLTGAPGNITVTGSTNYEVSTDDATFSSSVNVAYASATLSATPVYVRLKSGLTAGNYNSETISNAGGGATTQNVTASGTVYKVEPTDHVTSFASAAGTPSHTAINLSWVDASSGTAPDGYLIKGSTVGFGSIADPVDGTAESDAALVKNITQGTQAAIFSALSASTTYYFKIYPYTNSSTNINYKINGSVPTTSLATAAAPPATLLFSENFSYTASSDIAAQGGWQIIGTDGLNLTVSASTDLAYTNYVGTGGLSADITATRADDLGNSFTAQSGGAVYYSFLVNVSGSTGTGTYFTGLNTTATSTSYTGRVYAKINGTDVNFGLAKSSETATYSSTAYTVGTTYLLVVKYEFIAGSSNDAASLFVFTSPNVPSTEPGTPEIGPLAPVSTDNASLAGVFMRQASGVPDLTIDGMRISDGWPEAPLPVELTTFTVSTRGKGVELAWKTATEVNNYGFEIEKKAINNEQSTMNSWSKIGFVEGNGTTHSPKSYSFVDVSAQGKVAYRLKQFDRDGKFTYSNQVEAVASVISNYSLAQNHPNPFNPSTVISYQLPANSFVTLKVYDMIGKEIATLVNGMQEAGEHATSFNASHLPSGLYFYSLQTKNFNATKKMLLVK